MNYSIILFVRILFVIAIVHGEQIFNIDVFFESINLDFTELNAGDDTQIGRGKRAMKQINFSYPGTKWCGPGTTASHYHQLGKYSETDKCCRAHDHCDGMVAGEMKYGLRNDYHFTRMDCTCDKEFQKCLKNSNELWSINIRLTYFTVNGRCYMNQFPIIRCIKYERRAVWKRCVEYMLDTTQPKRYQWFDLPYYGPNNQSFMLDGVV